MAVMTTGGSWNLQYNLHTYYVKRLLETLQPRLQLYKLGKKTAFPKGLGTTVKWLIYTKISSSTSALSEGASGSEIQTVSANVTATLAQYGQYAKISDLLEFSAIDPVISSHVDLFGEAAAESVEDLIVAQLDGTLTARRVNARSTDDLILQSDVLSMDECLKAKIALASAYVKPHESGDFVVVLHPSCEYDILSESNQLGWLNAAMYAGPMQQQFVKGEIGRCLGMRFIVSDKMTAANNSGSPVVSVKKNYVLGGECFGCVEIPKSKDAGIELIVHKAGSAGVADPLNMYSTVGYKFAFVAKNFAAGRGRLLKSATSFA